MRKSLWTIPVLLLFAAGAVPVAHASSLGITYYTIAANDPDANHLAFGVFNNEVQSALGPDGLPVLNTAQFGCISGCYAEAGAPGNGTTTNNGQVVLSGPGAGEITYWDPALNSYVTKTGTGTVTLPFNVPSNFFPPNGTGKCDGPSPCDGYQAAVLSGNLIVPANTSETISFNIGADDMAFAYLNGQVVCDLGGVHASSAGTCITAIITTGATAESIPLDVFFVDINQVQSGLIFGVNTEGITTTATPEPGSLSLFGLGLAGLGFVKRRMLS